MKSVIPGLTRNLGLFTTMLSSSKTEAPLKLNSLKTLAVLRFHDFGWIFPGQQ